MSDNAILTCQHLSKSVSINKDQQQQALTILKDINFSVNKGESVAIIGQSGSGKTTLLSILAGLDDFTDGDLSLFGQSLKQLNEDQRAAVRHQYIGFVFQSFHLLPGFSAIENVMLPLEMNNDKQAKEKAQQLLERVGMGHRLDQYPNTLSGGEQQRVAIARAFASNPPLLMADEPTGNLDLATGQHVMDLLFELNQEQGTTLILVTHDNSLAQRCQRSLKIVDGQLEELNTQIEL